MDKQTIPPLKPIRPHWTSGDPFDAELRFCASHEFSRTHAKTPTAKSMAEFKERRRRAVEARMVGRKQEST